MSGRVVVFFAALANIAVRLIQTDGRGILGMHMKPDNLSGGGAGGGG